MSENLTPDEMRKVLLDSLMRPLRPNCFLTADEKARRIDAKSVMNSFYGVKAATSYHNFILADRRMVSRDIDEIIHEQATEKDMDPVLVCFNWACQYGCTKILLVPRHLDVQDMEKYLRKRLHPSVIITDIRILKPFDRTKGRFTK